MNSHIQDAIIRRIHRVRTAVMQASANEAAFAYSSLKLQYWQLCVCVDMYCRASACNMWKMSAVENLLHLTFNWVTSFVLSVLFHHPLPLLCFIFSCCLVSHVVWCGWCRHTSRITRPVVPRLRLSSGRCPLLLLHLSLSPHCGGCHSSVLPNKLTIRERRGGGGGRDPENARWK